MKTSAEVFEEYYQQWQSFSQSEAVVLSSRAEDYLDSAPFQAIVEMGEAAVPYIIEKLQSDESAHFLIHALERITQKRFTPAEIAAAGSRYGTPLGNQGFAALWCEWWDKQHSEKPGG